MSEDANTMAWFITLLTIIENTSLAAPGALANRLQRRTARKAIEAK